MAWDASSGGDFLQMDAIFVRFVGSDVSIARINQEGRSLKLRDGPRDAP
jgi:hypothetical protein